jgi:hypothetical protein
MEEKTFYLVSGKSPEKVLKNIVNELNKMIIFTLNSRHLKTISLVKE